MEKEFLDYSGLAFYNSLIHQEIDIFNSQFRDSVLLKKPQELTTKEKDDVSKNILDKSQDNGMGHIILEMNGSTIPGVLVQNMINQVNSVYVIKYDFDLNGATIIIPENCILKFDGGSFSNGTVVGNDTKIIASNISVFDGITISGTWNVPEITSAWFSDATSNNGLKNVFALQNANVHNRIIIEQGEYVVSATQEKDKILGCLSNLDLIIDGNITLLPNSYEAVYIVNIFNENHINITGSDVVIGANGIEIL